ncbi:MAG TPA: ABC transporter substrate-binding protein, partial [Umezawaea sp.]|nr:ABC transporter substrate-binding protein [Umezawaea sp.]
MSDNPDTPVALTHRAIAARETDPVAARELLGLALVQKIDYEPAWRWLAEVVEEPAERLFCLDRAFAIEADPLTGRARRELDGVVARPPREVEDLVEPPRPEAAGTPRRRGVWGAVVAVAVVLLSVVGVYSASGGQGGEPVFVALVAGMARPGSVAMERGLRMHLDAVNAAGGVDGHPVELLVYDDEDRADKATGIAEQIVREDRVMYVVGHGSSDTSLAAAPIYLRAHIPAITPSAGS